MAKGKRTKGQTTMVEETGVPGEKDRPWASNW